MPKPFARLVEVAEFGSQFEADLAIGALADAGIEAVASSDPALNSVAGYLATDRTVEVLVRQVEVDPARAVLEARPGVLPDAFSDEAVGDWPRSNRHRAMARRTIMAGLIALLLLMGLIAAAVALH